MKKEDKLYLYKKKCTGSGCGEFHNTRWKLCSSCRQYRREYQRARKEKEEARLLKPLKLTPPPCGIHIEEVVGLVLMLLFVSVVSFFGTLYLIN